MFQRDLQSGQWTQVAKLTASDGALGDNFGISVALSGDTAVIGAPWGDGLMLRSGAAYVFQRAAQTGQWTQVAKLTADDGATNDSFGTSVALSGDTAVIGSNYDDDLGTNSGSAYAFRRDSQTGQWMQVAKLTASDGAAYDYFGFSVAVSDDKALIGVYYDDDLGADSGSAHVVALPATDCNGNGGPDACEDLCPGDFTGDGAVEMDDLTALFDCWQQPCGDLNNDGATDLEDLGVIFANWGNVCPCP